MYHKSVGLYQFVIAIQVPEGYRITIKNNFILHWLQENNNPLSELIIEH
jgi:hypothetical protein